MLLNRLTSILERHLSSSTITLDCDPSGPREQLWQTNHPPPSNLLPPKESLPAVHNLRWTIWKLLNRLQSQVGCKEHDVNNTQEQMVKWGYTLKGQSTCDCSTKPQNYGTLTILPQIFVHLFVWRLDWANRYRSQRDCQSIIWVFQEVKRRKIALHYAIIMVNNFGPVLIYMKV